MKIGYSKTYPIAVNGQWEKIWLEEEIEGTTEDARKRLYALKKEVENFHYESNKAAEKELMQSAINHSRNFIDPDYAAPQQISPEQAMIDLINKCTTIPKPTGLEQYQVLAKKYPSIQEAYDKKLKELTNDNK